MAKLNFPKEQPSHTATINRARTLISEGSRESLLEAFDLISECAGEGSPRANYIKACLLFLDETEPGSYRENVLSALDRAIKGKYPLAWGLKASYMIAVDQDSLSLLVRTAQFETPEILYCEGCLFAEYFNGSKKVDRKKAIRLLNESTRLFLEYGEEYRRGNSELADIVICTGNENYYSERAAIAFRVMMGVYSDMDDKLNKSAYLSAYREAQKYGNAEVKFLTTCDYAYDCMDNVMGMHSLTAVNALMERASAQYAEAGGEEAGFEENYTALRDKYDEFYELEKRRLEALGEVAVYTTEGYGKESSLSVSRFASAVGSRLRQWANTPDEKPTYTVTMDNEEYTLDSRGEMIDRFGRPNGLKVDTANMRVYDEHNNLIGYFDSLGYFQKF